LGPRPLPLPRPSRQWPAVEQPKERLFGPLIESAEQTVEERSDGGPSILARSDPAGAGVDPG
jgi:hypothetical protein